MIPLTFVTKAQNFRHHFRHLSENAGTGELVTKVTKGDISFSTLVTEVMHINQYLNHFRHHNFRHQFISAFVRKIRKGDYPPRGISRARASVTKVIGGVAGCVAGCPA